MKTKNLLTVAAALLLAGCSQNEITEMSPDANPAIGFSVYSGVQTKGVEINAAGLKPGFGVFAYHTGGTAWSTAGATATPNFMYNQKVGSTDGTTWTYSPVKYWPKDEEKVTFFAYGPHSTIGGSGVAMPAAGNAITNAPQLTFAIENTGDATKMIDFVVAKNEASTTQDRTHANSAGGVTFTFQHVLSRLTFEAKPSVELATSTGTKGLTYVMVKSAKILQASSTKFYKSGVLDCKDATWSGKTKATDDYTITNVLALTDEKSIVTNAADQTSSAYKAVKLTSNATAKSLFTANQYLFLIPETAKAGAGTTTAGDVTIQFDYDIVTVDTAVSKGYTITHHTTNAKLPTGALKQGTAYKYTIVFGINEIKILTPIVEAWGSDTPGSVTV